MRRRLLMVALVGHYARNWAVNNYGSGISPSPFTIWVDDAEVRAP